MLFDAVATPAEHVPGQRALVVLESPRATRGRHGVKGRPGQLIARQTRVLSTKHLVMTKPQATT